MSFFDKFKNYMLGSPGKRAGQRSTQERVSYPGTTVNGLLRLIGVLLLLGGFAGTIWAGEIGSPWLAFAFIAQAVAGCVGIFATAAAFDNLLAVRKSLEDMEISDQG